MLKATNQKHIQAIEAWITKKAQDNHSSARYITIREYDASDLDGCVAYEVHWLGLNDIKMQNFYIDTSIDKIVYVTRYV
jgi:hypothetical protein